MLDNNGFDLWANSYDTSVNISDKENSYPFAGYNKLLNTVLNRIMENKKSNILDIGIGTGVLCTELYKNGYRITGVDFSDEMIKKCKARMPLAKLLQYDFSKGLPESIKNEKYHFIISTYAMHHLCDEEKILLINELLKILDSNGSIIIGDIGFETKKQFDECKKIFANIWDNDEYYIIFEEIKNNFSSEYKTIYKQISICAGITEIENNVRPHFA